MDFKEYIVFKQQQTTTIQLSNNITLRIEKINGRKWNWLFRFTNEVTNECNKMISVYYL